MTGTVSLFDLGAELARKHSRASVEEIGVIPVVVDDLDAALPVLRALCGVYEGRLFVRSPGNDELEKPVPKTSDAIRLAAIETALVSTRPSGPPRRIVLVDKPNDYVDAELRDPPAGPVPSPGEQEAMAIARACAHREFDERRLVVIAYRERSVDIYFQKPIWSLAVDQLNRMPHPTVRTLVFVAENQVDIERHCQTGRGFQLAVDGGRLLRRKGSDDLRIKARSIARHEKPVVLYLGGGFSASSRMPVGNALRDLAIRRLLGIPPSDDVTSGELGRRFHDWVCDQDWITPVEKDMTQQQFVRQLTVEQVIRAEQRMDPTLPTLRDFRDHHDRVLGAPGAAVLDLAHVLQRRVGRVIIVEVNFDRLVEAHAGVPLKVFASADDFREAPAFIEAYLAGRETAIPLLKLHGTISDLDTCVVSTEQTQLGIGAEKQAALQGLLSTTPRLWVYIGTSMRDLDLGPLLIGEEFARGVDERWVSPFLDESVEEFGRSREYRWRKTTDFPSTQDRLVNETADAFFAELRRAVDAT